MRAQRSVGGGAKLRQPTAACELQCVIIDIIVKGLETGLINTFPADSPRCAVDNIVDSFHGCF